MGFGHTGEGADIVKSVLTQYLSILGAGEYNSNGANADTYPLYEQGGVPMLNNYIADTP